MGGLSKELAALATQSSLGLDDDTPLDRVFDLVGAKMGEQSATDFQKLGAKMMAHGVDTFGVLQMLDQEEVHEFCRLAEISNVYRKSLEFHLGL